MHETWGAAGAEQAIYWAPSTGFPEAVNP